MASGKARWEEASEARGPCDERALWRAVPGRHAFFYRSLRGRVVLDECAGGRPVDIGAASAPRVMACDTLSSGLLPLSFFRWMLTLLSLIAACYSEWPTPEKTPFTLPSSLSRPSDTRVRRPSIASPSWHSPRPFADLIFSSLPLPITSHRHAPLSILHPFPTPSRHSSPSAAIARPILQRWSRT
jgi:hypothetical protein